MGILAHNILLISTCHPISQKFTRKHLEMNTQNKCQVWKQGANFMLFYEICQSTVFKIKKKHYFHVNIDLFSTLVRDSAGH